jgi:hypothetical protein
MQINEHRRNALNFFLLFIQILANLTSKRYELKSTTNDVNATLAELITV